MQVEGHPTDGAGEATRTPSSSPLSSSCQRSPENSCPICLNSIGDRAYTDACSHQFCFACIMEWSAIKAECPLCKQLFYSVMRCADGRKEAAQRYRIRQHQAAATAAQMAPGSSAVVNSLPITWDGLRAMQRQRAENRLRRGSNLRVSSSNGPNTFRHLMQSLGSSSNSRWTTRQTPPASVEFRRSLYLHNRRSQQVLSVNGEVRYRDVSPAFFRANPACTHRLAPWLNRELSALLPNDTGGSVSFLMDVVMSLVRLLPIDSEDFRRRLEPYLGDHAGMFAHELYMFARCPFEMAAFDRHVIYPPVRRASERSFMVRAGSGMLSRPLALQSSSSEDERESAAGEGSGPGARAVGSSTRGASLSVANRRDRRHWSTSSDSSDVTEQAAVPTSDPLQAVYLSDDDVIGDPAVPGPSRPRAAVRVPLNGASTNRLPRPGDILQQRVSGDDINSDFRRVGETVTINTHAPEDRARTVPKPGGYACRPLSVFSSSREASAITSIATRPSGSTADQAHASLATCRAAAAAGAPCNITSNAPADAGARKDQYAAIGTSTGEVARSIVDSSLLPLAAAAASGASLDSSQPCPADSGDNVGDDSDGSSDVVVVRVEKPWRDRTPVVLSSDDDTDEGSASGPASLRGTGSVGKSDAQSRNPRSESFIVLSSSCTDRSSSVSDGSRSSSSRSRPPGRSDHRSRSRRRHFSSGGSQGVSSGHHVSRRRSRSRSTDRNSRHALEPRRRSRSRISTRSDGRDGSRETSVRSHHRHRLLVNNRSTASSAASCDHQRQSDCHGQQQGNGEFEGYTRGSSTTGISRDDRPAGDSRRHFSDDLSHSTSENERRREAQDGRHSGKRSHCDSPRRDSGAYRKKRRKHKHRSHKSRSRRHRHRSRDSSKSDSRPPDRGKSHRRHQHHSKRRCEDVLERDRNRPRP